MKAKRRALVKELRALARACGAEQVRSVSACALGRQRQPEKSTSPLVKFRQKSTWPLRQLNVPVGEKDPGTMLFAPHWRR